MVALIILGLILLILIVILETPIGVDLGYEAGKLHVSAKAAGILIPLFPRPKKSSAEPKRPKKPKPKKAVEKPPEEPKPEKPRRKLPFTKEDIFELVKNVLKGMGRFGRAWKVDRFVFRYTAGGPDPYQVAVKYGYMNAALSTLAPICARRFQVKDLDIRTSVDFMLDHTHVDFGVATTIRLAQIFGVGLGIGFAALKILLRSKKRQKQQAKLQQNMDGAPSNSSGAADEVVPQIEEDKKETENSQVEERT